MHAGCLGRCQLGSGIWRVHSIWSHCASCTSATCPRPTPHYTHRSHRTCTTSAILHELHTDAGADSAKQGHWPEINGTFTGLKYACLCRCTARTSLWGLPATSIRRIPSTASCRGLTPSARRFCRISPAYRRHRHISPTAGTQIWLSALFASGHSAYRGRVSALALLLPYSTPSEPHIPPTRFEASCMPAQ